jgi:hypothetical protein
VVAVLIQLWLEALLAHQQLRVPAWVPLLLQHLVLLAIVVLVLHCWALLLSLQVPAAVFLSFLQRFVVLEQETGLSCASCLVTLCWGCPHLLLLLLHGQGC